MSMIPRSSSVFDPFSIDPFEGMGFPFFHNSGGTRWASGEIFAISGTRVDWKETPEAHVIKADLPGMKKEEVKVDVDGARVLRISGERKKDQEETDTWHRLERPRGKFIRSFRLPANAKVDQVSASMENGVLTVTVPKVEVKKPEVKSIDISG